MSDRPIRSYSGKLRVQDDDFELVAERFIPKDDGASFRFAGFDNLGGFSIEGFARRIDDLFVAGSVPLAYTHYSGDNRALVNFTSVREMYRQTECHVLGVWVQSGQTWTFKGTLQRFDPKRSSQGGSPAKLVGRAAPAHIATKREIRAIQLKLDKQIRGETETAKRERKLSEYAKKSKKKMRKSQRSKAKRRDIYAKGTRARGAGFSRRS